MTRTDSITFALIGLNIFLLHTFLTSFTVTNIIAVLDHGNTFGYVSLAATVIGLFLIFRTLVRGIILLQDSSEKEKLQNTSAVETLVVIICYALLFISNSMIFYFFNGMV